MYLAERCERAAVCAVLMNHLQRLRFQEIRVALGLNPLEACLFQFVIVAELKL